VNFPKSAEVHADCFGFRKFKAVSIHPVHSELWDEIRGGALHR